MDRAERTGLGVAVVGHVLLFAILSLGLVSTARLPPIVSAPIDVQFVDKIGINSATPEKSVEPPAPSEAPTVAPPEDSAAAEPSPAPAPAPSPKPARSDVPVVPPPPKPEPKPVEEERSNPKDLPDMRDRRRPDRQVTKPTPTKAKTEKPVADKPAPAKAAPAKTKPAAAKAWTAKSTAANPTQSKTAPTKTAGGAPSKSVGTAASGSGKTATKPATKAGGARLGKDFLKGIADTPAGKADKPRAAAVSAVAMQGLAAAISRQFKPCYELGSLQGTPAMSIVTTLRLRYNVDGTVSVDPTMVEQSGVNDANRSYARQIAEVAKRAVLRCTPVRLPAEIYKGGWDDFQLRFIPGQLG